MPVSRVKFRLKTVSDANPVSGDLAQVLIRSCETAFRLADPQAANVRSMMAKAIACEDPRYAVAACSCPLPPPFAFFALRLTTLATNQISIAPSTTYVTGPMYFSICS